MKLRSAILSAILATVILLPTGARASGSFVYNSSSISAIAQGDIVVLDSSVTFSTTSGSFGIVFQDQTPMTTNLNRLLIGGVNIGVTGSNAGIQYSGIQANRGQIRMNQFGDNSGTAGLTAFKSRGVDVSSLSPVFVNDELLRLNAIAVSPNNSIPIVGSFIVKAASAAHVTSAGYVPTQAELLLVNYNNAATYSALRVDAYGSLTMASSGTFNGSVNANSFSGSGCVSSLLTNRSGISLSSGTLVEISPNYDFAVTTTSLNDIMPIGAIQDIVGCADGAVCSVGVQGRCLVRIHTAGTCSRGYFMATSGDDIGTAQCLTGVIPVGTHNQEIGHALRDGAAGSVIEGMLHFN